MTGPKRGPPRYPLVPDCPADAFVGAAVHYARYRLPYPDPLIDALRVRTGVTGRGRLLDLACGTGQLALPLSPFFRSVLAVDREPEMIEVGRRAAAARGLANIDWHVARAEAATAPAGAFELITVGNAFHRLERRLIAGKALDWLVPGGCLAVAGSTSLWRGEEAWHALVRDLIRDWVPKRVTDRGGRDPACDQPRETHAEALDAAGFDLIGEAEFARSHVWSLDEVVGYVFSLSRSTPRVLGRRAAAFEAELRRCLLAHDARGRYREVVRFFLILSRRPGP